MSSPSVDNPEHSPLEGRIGVLAVGFTSFKYNMIQFVFSDWGKSMSVRRFGLTGSERSRTRPHDWEGPRTRRTKPWALGLVILLVLSSVALAFAASVPWKNTDPSTTRTTSTLTLNLILNCQHKDTNMLCQPDGPFCVPPNGAHAWNDASGADGLYGTFDDCPHCSCYCVPACISMISAYRGRIGNFIQQDDICDNGKSSGGEITGNGILETHGVGMYDGAGGPTEVQASFVWSLGLAAYIEHNSTNPLNAVTLAGYIAFGYPVLWVDRDGWPANQSPSYPNPAYRPDLGHAKVIAGWDDNGSLLDSSDDLCLIYDPWPEYNDKNFLPTNATQGPGGTFDPYWIPQKDVLSDPSDVFLRDTFAPIPEFNGILIPVLGFALIAAVLIGRRDKLLKNG